MTKEETDEIKTQFTARVMEIHHAIDSILSPDNVPDVGCIAMLMRFDLHGGTSWYYFSPAVDGELGFEAIQALLNHLRADANGEEPPPGPSHWIAANNRAKH